MNPDQITIVCLIKAKKSTKEAVKQELLHLQDMTRQEKGNINYDLHISANDDCLFIIYENWKNQQALDNHMAQLYLKSFIEKQDELLECPIDGKICKIICQ
jgi:quinol monooxygenase YgiN